MTMFIIQSLLLMAIAYILGCILGCILHRLFVSPQKAAVAAAPVAAAAAVAPKVEPKPAPKPMAVAQPEPAPAPKPAPAPAAKPKAAPKPKAKTAKPKPAAAPAGAKDDLKRIRGIGPQNEGRLNNFGVTQFAQIAAWTKKDEREMGERLAFPGRIEREEWVKQAKVLAKGGVTDFAKRVDKGEVESSIGKADAGNMGVKPPVMASAPAGGGDNLTLIDGVGNALEKKLQALGIYTFDQIAKWNKDNEAWIGNQLGFPGRSERENWVGEAKILAKGGTTEHAKRVERGEITTSRKSDK